MANVFLSYSKFDRPLAEQMSRALFARGLSVWWDDDLTPRESWDRTIEREIAAADYVLVLWTRHSIDSDWVRIEANYARNCRPSKLVQARFDDSMVPIAFSMVQYVDLDPERPERSSSWPRLIEWLHSEKGVTHAPAPPNARPVPEAAEASVRLRVPWPEDAEVGLALGWLLAGAILYTSILVATLFVNSELGESPLSSPAVFLTPAFGGLYVWRTWGQDGRWRRLLYFAPLLTLVHEAAAWMAWMVLLRPSQPAAYAGAAAGGGGAALSLLLLFAIFPGARQRSALVPGLGGVLVLAAIGAAGVSLGWAAVARSPTPIPAIKIVQFYLAMQPAWQLAFAAVLSRFAALTDGFRPYRVDGV